jgi:hypothetical protein
MLMQLLTTLLILLILATEIYPSASFSSDAFKCIEQTIHPEEMSLLPPVIHPKDDTKINEILASCEAALKTSDYKKERLLYGLARAYVWSNDLDRAWQILLSIYNQTLISELLKCQVILFSERELEAVKFCENASKLGSKSADYYLGIFYQAGISKPVNWEHAQKHYLSAQQSTLLGENAKRRLLVLRLLAAYYGSGDKLKSIELNDASYTFETFDDFYNKSFAVRGLTEAQLSLRNGKSFAFFGTMFPDGGNCLPRLAVRDYEANPTARSLLDFLDPSRVMGTGIQNPERVSAYVNIISHHAVTLERKDTLRSAELDCQQYMRFNNRSALTIPGGVFLFSGILRCPRNDCAYHPYFEVKEVDFAFVDTNFLSAIPNLVRDLTNFFQ